MNSGILFNHKSVVRRPEFVTRKVSRTVAWIASGDRDHIELGNLSARKDWGYAKDCVEGMWSMLQYKYGDEFIIGTEELHTVRNSVEEAFRVVDINVHWKGSWVNEVGPSDSDEVLVKVNRKFFRPLESDNYMADYTKGKERTWLEPKTVFTQLVTIMVKYDAYLIEKRGTNPPA